MTSALEILSRTFRPVDVQPRIQAGCRVCGTALVGVYLLVWRDEITYVGSTTDLQRRLYAHQRDRHRRRRRFDRVLWLPLPAVVLPHYEGALIRALRTRDNSVVHAPRFAGYDAEILFGLGLRSELSDDDLAVEELAA